MDNNNWISYKGDKLTKPEEVEGFDKLSNLNKRIFTGFLNNYYKVWEFPENNQPTKVSLGRGYLKVDFEDTWLHVTEPNTWY